VSGLYATAGNGDSIGGDELKARRSLPQVIIKREHRCFFHADAAAAQPAIGDRRRRESARAFVLLPDTHFGGEAELLTEAAFFKRWTNDDRLAFCGMRIPSNLSLGHQCTPVK
jgi:hypothetical protein